LESDICQYEAENISELNNHLSKMKLKLMEVSDLSKSNSIRLL